MNLSRPLETVTSGVDGDVLAALALADAWFTAARLTPVAGRWSVDGVRKSLRRLADQGVVDAEPAGPAVLYRLNRDHLAAGPIVQLANLRTELVRRLRESVLGWSVRPTFAALFGSATGMRMTRVSDIDVLLVRPEEDPSETWLGQTLRLQAEAGRWTGNDVRVLEFSEEELEDREVHRAVLDDVLAVGITVAGDRDWLARRMRVA